MSGEDSGNENSSQDETSPERVPQSRIAQRQNALADSASPRRHRQSRGGDRGDGNPFTIRRDKQRKIRSSRVHIEKTSIVALFCRTPSEDQPMDLVLTEVLGRGFTSHNDDPGLEGGRSISFLKQARSQSSFSDEHELAFSDEHELAVLKKRFEACFRYSQRLCNSYWIPEKEGLIDQNVTILTCDARRAVVNLSPIHTVEVTHLCGALDALVKRHATLLPRTASSPKRKTSGEDQPWDFEEFARFITWKLRRWESPTESGLWLVSKTLLPGYSLSTRLESESVKDLLLLVELMELALQIMDVALTTHMSAHVCQDQSTLLQSTRSELRLPLNGLEPLDRPVLVFEQRKLACLSGLTGSRTVWVFHTSDQTVEEPLYLSASVEEFALVWGPVWKAALGKDESTFKQYNVGGGSIIPWKYEDGVHPPLKDNERLCHWMRLEDDDRAADWSDSTDGSEQILADERPDIVVGEKAFMGSERLLVGARRSPKLMWSSCECSIQDFKETMKGSHRLHPLRSRGLFRYVDARAAGVTVGSHGVQLTGTATWKTDKGQTMKEGFLEEWENNPQSWDPRDLEDFRGILVSFCTMNARRVRLVELLATDSLLLLIDRVHWSDMYSLDGVTRSERKRSFVEALESNNPFALRELWEARPGWRKDMGNALLTCVRALVKTGYDEERNVFNVLWAPKQEKKLMRLELYPREHSWIEMLKDTEDSMTMAVLIEDSLGMGRKHRHGRSCGHLDRLSILETAINVNRRIREAGLTETSANRLKDPPPWRWADRRWQKVWNVRNVPENTQLWISPTSRLKVVRRLTNSHLLLECDPVIREMIRAAFGMRPGERQSHWEYATDVSDDDISDEDSEAVRPIPVHVQ
jgi:hypothetical protein